MPPNQPPNVFTVYDSALQRVNPDISTPARAAAVNLEGRIRGDADETGAFFRDDGTLIIKKTGLPNKIGFSAGELYGTKGTLFTHNHPGGNPPSWEDVRIAIDQELAELRVVTPSPFIRYIMRPSLSSPWPSYRSLVTTAQSEVRKITQDVHARVRAGELSSRNASVEIAHLIWERLSQTLGFEYIQEAS